MNNHYVSFIPRTDAELARWATVYKEKIGTLGLQVGLTANDITTHQDAAQVIIDAINKVKQRKQEQEEAVSFKDLVRKREVQFLASQAVRIKRHSNFTDNIGSELGIMGSSIEPVRLTLKPLLKLAVFPGYIEVSFVKKSQPGVVIYSRVKGDLQWTKLAYTPTSPYTYNRPLETAGVAETREFMAQCSDGDVEIGQLSDIVSTLYGG